MVPLRPHEILELSDDSLSGGARLTSARTEPPRAGLMGMLKALAERPPIQEITVSRALVAADEGTILEVDPGGGTVTLTLPADLPVGFYAAVRQVTAGTVRFAAGAGAAVDAFGSPSPIDLGGEWASATVEVRAADTWIVTGQLA